MKARLLSAALAPLAAIHGALKQPVTWGSTSTLTWRGVLVIAAVYLLALDAIRDVAALGGDSGFAYAIAGLVGTVVLALGFTVARGAQAHAGQYQGGTSPTAAAAAGDIGAGPPAHPSSAGARVLPEETADL